MFIFKNKTSIWFVLFDDSKNVNAHVSYQGVTNNKLLDHDAHYIHWNARDIDIGKVQFLFLNRSHGQKLRIYQSLHFKHLHVIFEVVIWYFFLRYSFLFIFAIIWIMCFVKSKKFTLRIFAVYGYKVRWVSSFEQITIKKTLTF